MKKKKQNILKVPTNKETAVRFLHCLNCLRVKPDGIAPRDWARLSCGIMKDGAIEVWCVRCEMLVGRIDTALAKQIVKTDCPGLPARPLPKKGGH